METRELKQALKARHLSLIALGGIIGSAYFLGTGFLLEEVGPAAFLAYLLGAIITYFTMSCLSELTLASPSKGSFIAYAARYINPTWACGVGWSYWMTWVVYIPSECLAAGMIMHGFFPDVSPQLFAMLFGLIVSAINVCHVKAFGEIEFWLSLIKVAALALFSLCALGILFGWIGNAAPVSLGTKFLVDQGGFFPNGSWVLLLNMVILLVNFQGSEIIGLSASEAKDASKAVPQAIKQLVVRIICIYLIPTLLIAAIFPWNQASLNQSVFAAALNHYGFSNLAAAFTFVVLIAAISCANTGLFGAVRSLHALGHQGMAPRIFSHISKQGVPAKATIITLAAIWAMLGLGALFPTAQLYKLLLGVSGFTGAVCWISICWSQLRFRQEWRSEGKHKTQLPFRINGFPYMTHLSIWIQVACLFVLAFNNDLRPSLYAGLVALLVPCSLHWLYKKGVFRSKKVFDSCS